eukprot:TRINITY_DN18994_c0_g1_i1.p1 TRINITY_DN18994_c0_g1~~TRINITY_DN18994_c0_g1_i1.p1  ORF type:complete len:153 (+),score=13.13 TRINITY_DN18994_c0_g1_i1:118-576(+)
MENIEDFSISDGMKLDCRILAVQKGLNISHNVFSASQLASQYRFKSLPYFTTELTNDYFKEPIENLKTLMGNPFREVSCNEGEDPDSEGEVLNPKAAITFIKGNKKFALQSQYRTTYIEHALNLKEVYVLSLIHICRCRRYAVCRSRWSPYH